MMQYLKVSSTFHHVQTVAYLIRLALPSKLKVISANCYGTSAWSTTASIHTKDNDGQILRFFIKYASGEHGKAQIEGEFRSMQEIYQTMPNFAPQPCSFGQAKTASLPTYFFICEFVNISDELPDPRLLGARLAQLHKQSQSPTGKFGFYCPTYDGKLPQETDWDDSWVSFFTKLLKGVAELDAGVNGRWNELDEILQATTETVIPRLLGPLERDGRRIKPCLIHGDLWEGNIGTDIETGELYVFDAASYYGHNEMELGIWRTDHHRMNGSSYKREYERNFRASEPIEEWDDRNRLYCVKTQLMYSAHIPGTNVRNA